MLLFLAGQNSAIQTCPEPDYDGWICLAKRKEKTSFIFLQPTALKVKKDKKMSRIICTKPLVLSRLTRINVFHCIFAVFPRFSCGYKLCFLPCPAVSASTNCTLLSSFIFKSFYNNPTFIPIQKEFWESVFCCGFLLFQLCPQHSSPMFMFHLIGWRRHFS